jgi:hypothetical protein
MSYRVSLGQSASPYGSEMLPDGSVAFDASTRATLLSILSQTSIDPNNCERFPFAFELGLLWQLRPDLYRAFDAAVGAALLGYTVLLGTNFGAAGVDHMLIVSGGVAQIAGPDQGAWWVLLTPDMARQLFPGGPGSIGITLPPLPPAPSYGLVGGAPSAEQLPLPDLATINAAIASAAAMLPGLKFPAMQEATKPEPTPGSGASSAPPPPPPGPLPGQAPPPPPLSEKPGLFGLTLTQTLYVGAGAVGLLLLFTITRK